MIALRFEFRAGRFHANPWDINPNGRDLEWPPSPWLLLHAIARGWRCSGADHVERLATIISRLADPPRYILPRATSGRSRHGASVAVPQTPEAGSVALDSFIALERDREPIIAAYALWPHVHFDEEQRNTLIEACGCIDYLGRRESRCTISLVDCVPETDENEHILLASMAPDIDGPIVRRLAADPSLQGADLLAALKEVPASNEYIMPRGTQWVEYRLPADFLMVREQYERPERTRPVFGSTLLRFAMGRGRRAHLPRIEDAVVISEVMRGATLSRFSDRNGEPVTHRLAGKSEGGGKREGHDHPFYLPLDEAGHGYIDGIDVWLPRGCTFDEYLAITSIEALYDGHFLNDRFPLTFIGEFERPCARVWQSATPIVLNRFPKSRGPGGSRLMDSPQEQIHDMLLDSVGCSAEIQIWEAERMIAHSDGTGIPLDAFRRRRLNKPAPPLPVAAATIYFDEPVDGPIVLGRLAHFGLGRFEPLLDPRP